MTAFFALALAVDQPAASVPLPINATTVATVIQQRLPQRFSPDIAMVGAMAEGDLLVLSYELSDVALAAATPEALSLRFLAAFCSAAGGRELLNGPTNFRADARSPNGRSLQGLVIESCPLPVPTGRR